MCKWGWVFNLSDFLQSGASFESPKEFLERGVSTGIRLGSSGHFLHD